MKNNTLRNAAVLSLGYLPPVEWFVVLAKHDEIILEQCEHYVKGSFRNRCQIIGANGLQRLTVPLRKGKNEQQPIKEVRIAYDEPWQIRHWRAICSAYGSSPFFEHFADAFSPFYLQKRYEFLWDWNYDLFNLSLRLLKINRAVEFTEKFESEPFAAVDYRGLLDKNLSLSPIIKLPKYPQVFEDRYGFLQNPSILDLVMCAGKLPI